MYRVTAHMGIGKLKMKLVNGKYQNLPNPSKIQLTSHYIYKFFLRFQGTIPFIRNAIQKNYF